MSHIRSGHKLFKRLAAVFPPLEKSAWRGQNGRIGVIGGSYEFTGAPYYSAIAALRVGGDLSHIFSSKFSSAAIKTYSPEIITHPIFISDEEVELSPFEEEAMLVDWSGKIRAWQRAIHTWIIGPGLGRCRYMNQFFPRLVNGLPSGCVVVFDADAIYYLDQHPELFDQLSRFRTILTPNYKELLFLQKRYNIDPQAILAKCHGDEEITEIPSSPKNPPFTVIVKGHHDIVLSRQKSFVIRTKGGKKRCGGIGDVLAGSVAVCGLWDFAYGPALASSLVKEATRLAFEKEGRGMTAPLILEQLALAVKRFQTLG